MEIIAVKSAPVPLIRVKGERTHRDIREINNILANMKTEMTDADKLIKECDPRSIHIMSKIGGIIERYKHLYSEPDYQKLLRDSKLLEKYFMDLCECKPLIQKKKI